MRNNAAANLKSLWEVSVQHEGQGELIRRVFGPALQIGSSSKSQIKVPRPGPDVAFRAEKNGGDIEILAPEGSQVELKIGGKWVKKTSYKSAKAPDVRLGGVVYQIRDVSAQNFQFEPVSWAARLAHGERHALWHFRGDVLIETIMVENHKQKVTMKCGYEFIWNPKKSGEIILKSHDGQVHTLPLEPGPKESLRAKLGQDVFFFTALPDEAAVTPNVVLPRVLTPKTEISKFTKGLGIFWLLFIVAISFWPKPDANLEKEVDLESLGTDMPSITLENHKNPGGNGRRGGGGVETVQTKDPRGGQGHTKSEHSPKVPLQAYKAAKHSAPIGAKAPSVHKAPPGPIKAKTVAKAAPAAPVKATSHAASAAAPRKTQRSNVGVGNEFIGAPKSGIFSAVAKLDAGVKSGRVGGGGGGGAVAVGGGNDATGRDGVLGTLGKMNGRSGGGGLGLGGVGTKGFGGGGGGGRGAGFGTGIGEGLGEGHGTRQIAFGTGGTLVRGGLEKSEIDAVVQENLSQIRYCYNLAMRTNNNLQGKVISAFTIGSSGHVKSSRIKSSTMRAPQVDSCIASRIASWTFPKPRGGGEVSVSYPFMLRAN